MHVFSLEEMFPASSHKYRIKVVLVALELTRFTKMYCDFMLF